MKLELVKASKKYNREQLFALRTLLVKAIDPFMLRVLTFTKKSWDALELQLVKRLISLTLLQLKINNKQKMEAELYPKVYLYKRIVQAKLFIDNNYAGKIDLENISDKAYFSKFHFIRLFKEIYGKTPHQYLTFVRIEKAIQLLRVNKPVTEVCYAVGFETVSSFGSLFKRTVGVTPSAFQEEQQQIKLQILHTPLKFVPGCFVHQHGWNGK